MRTLNKFMKALAMIPVHLLMLAYSGFLSVLTTSPIVIVVCSIISAVSGLPEIMVSKFWLVYLIATIPLTVIYFILIETDRIKEVPLFFT